MKKRFIQSRSLAIMLSLALVLMSVRDTVFCQQSVAINQNAKATAAQEKLNQDKQTVAPMPPQQTSATLDVQSEKIRQQIEKMGVGKRISVRFKNGDEHYGSIASITERTFQLADVDQKQTITISYDEVKKVWSGYGGHTITGKRVNPKHTWIFATAFLGFLLVVVPLIFIPKT